MQEDSLSSPELRIKSNRSHRKGKEKKKKLRNTVSLKNSSTSLPPQRLLPLLEAEALALDPQDFKETQDRLFPKDFFDTVVK